MNRNPHYRSFAVRVKDIRPLRNMLKKHRRDHRMHVGGECPQWEKHPLSTEPGDPPGTRIIDGKKWTPSTDPSHEPCTMCSEDGECWVPWTPPGGQAGSYDPDTTPLSKFPKFPVSYLQEAQVGTDKVGPARVVKRLEEIAATGRPLNARILDERASMAVRWVAVAEKYATTVSRKKWIARLKREFYEYPMQTSCTINCRPKYRHLWLIANAAQYLAERFSSGQAKPPYVAPPKSVLEGTSDWAGDQITQVLKSRLGWYVAGGVAVLIAGVAVVGAAKTTAGVATKRLIPRRRWQ